MSKTLGGQSHPTWPESPYTTVTYVEVVPPICVREREIVSLLDYHHVERQQHSTYIMFYLELARRRYVVAMYILL